MAAGQKTDCVAGRRRQLSTDTGSARAAPVLLSPDLRI